MADVFSILIDILKINQALVNQYATLGTLHQLFYLFFFPILFIVIFIYIIAGWAIPQHRGLRFLLSMAVFAFIVLEGWYSFFVSISKFWLFLTVLLGFILFIFHKREGGGARGKVLGPKGGGLLGDIKKRMKGELTGEFKQREHLINSMLDQIEDAMKKTTSSDVSDIDNVLGGGGGAMVMMARIYQMVWDLRQDSAIWNFASDRIIRLIKRYNKVAHTLGAKTIAEK